jgi:hypothetical protein
MFARAVTRPLLEYRIFGRVFTTMVAASFVRAEADDFSYGSETLFARTPASKDASRSCAANSAG